MKIFLATASLDEIRWAARSGLLDGVLTTPATLAEERREGDEAEQLVQIAGATGAPVAPVVASVHAFSAADVYRGGRELARLSDRIVVQVPLVEDAMEAIRRLSAEGIRVAATLVFNAAQALLAAKAGASIVGVQLEPLDAVGTDPAQTIAAIRAILDSAGAECDVMAIRPRTAAQFIACARAGADAAAVAPSVLRALMLHPLTDRGVDQFLNDLSRLPRSRAEP